MNTTVETETSKKAVAKHFLLGADGAVVEDFEKAGGIRYVDISSGSTVDYVPKSADAIRMLAAFGARTLATNEASAVRQKDGTSQEQIDAINERFALIETGTWVDRTREAGPRYDLPTLSTAAVTVMVKAGAVQDTDEAKGKAYAGLLKTMTEDAKKVAVVRGVDGVDAEYKRLRGAKTATAADLAALVA